MKEQLNAISVEVITALLTLISAYLSLYLKRMSARVKAETQFIQDQQQAELVRRALERLDEVAEKTVAKLEQTVAADVRKTVKDGGANREMLLEIGERAYKEVMSTIEPEVFRVLCDTMGDLDAYARSTIEAKVRQIKLENLELTTRGTKH